MKINENAPLIPPNTGTAKPVPGSNSTANTTNTALNQTSASAVSRPAVNLDIGLAAKLAEAHSSTSATNQVSDELLIKKLRDKVAAGQFEIDYNKISQSMLKDVVAAIGQKPSRP
ncbi:flagellar biosynthesis anti-sigma factor FlgM [Polynucleobacter bastaniensis]|uniref:flagellar biosynthesis anti-sigma factor FlgM n=1 Tax=Polynucleobacter bastaniensis TaxID=2081039 RepID=UPI001C0B354F|nr:flagellar biosynthesis anti-sigma factor FlgM [Polynucleobacter bastaniensis]MBU3598368.1 flagellar biosynthesis anti-sigma factor FlgM [Polynucleobacter bastaniensis]